MGVGVKMAGGEGEEGRTGDGGKGDGEEDGRRRRGRRVWEFEGWGGGDWPNIGYLSGARAK
ncbi:MAG: hypothetical protein AAF798_05565 [Bacteroidota bacterium]